MVWHRVAVVALAAIVLGGCWGKPLTRYNGYRIPAAAFAHNLNGKGDVLLSRKDGSKTLWEILHPGKDSVPIAGVPAHATLSALSDTLWTAGTVPVDGCQPPADCLRRLFLLVNGKVLFVPLAPAPWFVVYFDHLDNIYGQYGDKDRKGCSHAFTLMKGTVAAVDSPSGYQNCSDFSSVTGSGLAEINFLPAAGGDENTFVYDKGKLSNTTVHRTGQFWTSDINADGIVTGTFWPNNPSPKDRVPSLWKYTDGSLTDVAVPGGHDCEGVQTWDNGAVLARCEKQLSVLEQAKMRRLNEIVTWPQHDSPGRLEGVVRYNDHGDMLVYTSNGKAPAIISLLLRN